MGLYDTHTHTHTHTVHTLIHKHIFTHSFTQRCTHTHTHTDLSGAAGLLARLGGAGSQLSLLSVTQLGEELERSPSGFSVSSEREESEGSRRGQTQCCLAEGETDTDSELHTPSTAP